tara:strand:+ start:457 stop:642 length:186 start_codon:yes stop_codon:yes gene_type:complete
LSFGFEVLEPFLRARKLLKKCEFFDEHVQIYVAIYSLRCCYIFSVFWEQEAARLLSMPLKA